jgi:excinuclease ABC subunit C
MLEYPDQIRNTLKNLPSEAGVYRFYSISDELLYVGKAKNLKNRVTTYFQANRIEGNARLSLMVSQIARIDYTIVSSENESLILEANLINSLQPKYNILLKDDRNYLYVRITNSRIPFITFTRKKYDKTSSYYGPYTKKYDIINVLRLIRLILPYCEKKSIGELGSYDSPCQYVQLKQCDGICCGRETIEDYNFKISQIRAILDGKTNIVKDWLNTKILDSINIENYELAGLYRDRLLMLDRVISDQKIILPKPLDLDIVTLIYESNLGGSPLASVFVQTIREGRMVNVNNFILSGGVELLEDSEFNLDDAKVLDNELKDDLGNITITKVVEKTLTDKIKDTNSDLGFEFLKTFLSSYYSSSEKVVSDSKIEVVVQCYENGR